MKVLKWIIENWDSILVLIALFAGVIAGLIKFVKNWKDMTNEERVAYVKRLLENLLPIAIKLVTLAEKNYGGGTGELKRVDVIDQLYSRIPDEFKPYVTEQNLDSVLETALEKARVIWEENAAINKLIIDQEPKTKVVGFSANTEGI